MTPPVQPTLNTERATFKVMYPKMVSTSTEFIPVKDSTEKTTLKDSETDSTTQKTTTFQTEDPQEDFIYMGLNGPKVPIVKNSTIHTKESDCQSHCLAENCDFFVVKDSVCHLGYYGQNETYFLEGLISLFVSPDKISEEYSEQFEESLAYEDLLRSQQISSESGVTETQCLWNCIVTECQFYYFKNDICSLGQWKSGVQSDSNSQVQFHFKNIGNFTFDYTPMILHHDVSNLTKIEGEISLFSCLTRSYSLQHDFAVFDNGTCYIDGDLNKAQNSAINQSIQIQGYIKSGIKSSRQFDHIKIPKDVYSDLMTWDTFEDINDTNICAGICQAKSVSQCVAFYLENEVCYTSSEIKFGWTMQNDFSSELRTIYGKRNMEIDSEFLMRYPVQISKQTHTVKTIQSSSLWGCLVSCKWVDTCQGIYFENEICSLITEFPIQISPSQVQDLTVQDWESSNFYLKIFDTLQIANETGFKEKPREGYKKYECPANKFALVGNGHCDDASNVEECNWDNYECCGVVIQKGKCTECKCHRSGRQQLDIKEDLKCSLIHSGLTYIDNGICNQHVNYGECLLFDAGDCCDPRYLLLNVMDSLILAISLPQELCDYSSQLACKCYNLNFTLQESRRCKIEQSNQF